MQRLLWCDQQLAPGDEAFRSERRALLPDVTLRVSGVSLQFWVLARCEFNALRLPIVTDQSHETAGTDNSHCVPLFTLALVPMWVEVVKAGLHMGDHSLPVVEQHHRVIFLSHFDLSL